MGKMGHPGESNRVGGGHLDPGPAVLHLLQRMPEVAPFHRHLPRNAVTIDGEKYCKIFAGCATTWVRH